MYLLLFLALGCGGKLFPQISISGEINDVSSAVTSIGSDYVTVTNLTGFAPGDTVLVIQMKGAIIYTLEDGSYGTPDALTGTPGGYEFIIIQSIIPADRIVFGSNLLNAYSVVGMVQVIKVRSYPSARVTGGALTCKPWDPATGTGGVLAFIVGGNLYLDNNIDVSGRGFRGGGISGGTGICAVSDPVLRNRHSYPATDNYSGFKGEGIAVLNHVLQPLYPNYAKGRGANFTGGGGGNGRFAGGGGGSSFGKGGNGNRELQDCSLPSELPGGVGGIAPDILAVPEYQNAVFMGSGGGASTYTTGGTVSPGGNGGGIVIIVADTIHGNGHSIFAHGRRPAVDATGNAGAGGGGAGGSIAVSANSYGTGALRLSVNGGAGGNTTNTNGSGGGGGGGRIWSSKVLTANITAARAGGAGGRVNYEIGDTTSGGSPGGAGLAGIQGSGFAVKLNGFLFNTIRSSFPDYTDVDSICSGQVPMKLMGTVPVGGTTPYTFLWQKSYDPAFTIAIDLTNTEAPGGNFTPYQTETNTLWFRRIVTDASGTPIVDISKAVRIIVHPPITDNVIGKDTTICFGQDPLALTHYNADPAGGNGIYNYQWNESLDNITFTPAIVNTNSEASYDPPPLEITKFYQRVITSARCSDVSNSVKITVLPLLGNNTVAADQVICEADLFADLTGSVPTGGNGSYTYGWLSRTSSTSWSVASGAAALQNYNPDESAFPATRLFSRVVYSGASDVCRDTSALVTLTMHPQISNNILDIAGSTLQTVCYDSLPGIITGGIPLGGDGASYTFSWEQSPNGIDSWVAASGTNDERDFQPPPLQSSRYLRRVVRSSACTHISNTITITVHQPITAFNVSLISPGSDTTLCLGATPHLLKGELSGGGTGIPGDYQYSWFYSEDNVTWIPVPSAGTGADYQPGTLSVTTYFRREVVSGACMRVSNVVTVTVLPLIGNNILPPDRMTCFNTAPPLVDGSLPTGGSGSYTFLWEQSTNAGVNWSNAAGTNNDEDYQSPAISIPTLFRRVVYSGLADCCTDVSLPVSIGINPLPTGNITSVADTVCQGGNVTMELSFGGSTATPYSIVYSNGAGNVTIPSVVTATHSVSLTPPTLTGASTTTNYTLVSVTDANGCQATALTGTYEVVAYRNPVPRTIPDNSDEVCGLIYDLTPVPGTGIGEWLKPGVPVSGVTDLGGGRERLEVSGYGTWSMWWKETNWKCRDSVKLDIRFWEEPSPVAAGPGSTITLDFVKLDAAVPVTFTSMGWIGPADVLFDDSGNPATWARGLRLGSNRFTWTVENGKCVLDEEITVTYNPIPEGFSPDGDNINELFEIPGLEGTENELVILNISGGEVRRFTNYSSLTGYWDGKDRNGKDLPDGTYYYFLTVTKPYQSKIPGGYVIIKRRIDD